jgi:hypothetical protein
MWCRKMSTYMCPHASIFYVLGLKPHAAPVVQEEDVDVSLFLEGVRVSMLIAGRRCVWRGGEGEGEYIYMHIYIYALIYV